MNIQLSKNVDKILPINFKCTMKHPLKEVSQKKVLADFIEGVEAITGLTFKELHILLANCALKLAEADIYSLDESYWEKAIQLAEANNHIAGFANQIKLPLT